MEVGAVVVLVAQTEAAASARAAAMQSAHVTFAASPGRRTSTMGAFERPQ
jgi:hypothetical protein